MTKPTPAQIEWTARVLGYHPLVTAPPRAVDAFERVRDAVQALEDAQAAADVQIADLQAALRGTKDPVLLRIADAGLNGISGNVRVPLQAALFPLKASGARPDARALRKAADAAGRYAEFLRSDRRVGACDRNPFGVRCRLARTLVPPLQRLQESIASAASSG